jgi:hypothetical protein
MGILSEDLRRIEEVAGPLNVTPQCVRLWCRRGVGGHRLEFVRVGRRLMTSKQAVDRFLRAINSPET